MSELATIHASMDAVMQAFQHSSEKHAHMVEHCGMSTWLHDYRTMGFHTPRQNGATSWMLKRLLTEPDALLVSRFREQLIVNFNAEGVCDVMGHKRTIISVEDQARIIEPYDLSQWVKSGQVFDKPLKLILLDSSCTVFNNVRINRFYDWLAMCPGVTKDTQIIRMN